MQPSQSDIQREFEALRDIRRRSSSQGGPGALILDPDLPNTQPTSPNAPLSPQSDHSTTVVGDDSYHLFWVPASLHPELAPGEFQSFLKEHAREGGATLSRSGSGSSNLGRKRSMLSRQYKPREGDGVEKEEPIMPLRRNKSGVYAYPGPQLSINDLEKLEQLAEEASKSDDPTKLRSVLRRSLSMNVSPSVIDQIDMPDTGDDADAPIIVPPPNQILRRTARTKIRKPGLPGDGGGHRFASSRKRSGRGTRSSSDHGSGEAEVPELPIRKQSIPSQEEEAEDEDARKRDTFTEESFIYDAYATDDHDDSHILRSPPTSAHSPLLSPPTTYSEPEPEPEPIPETFREYTPEPPVPSTPPVAPIPQLHHPQPQHQRGPAEQGQMPRTPSPDAPSPSASPDHFHRTDSRSSIDSHAPSFLNSPPQSQHSRKEKEKKGILKGWGGSKGSKKGDEKARGKDQKDPGFLSSIFGGGKKKQEDQPPVYSGLGGGAGPATAAAMLGASKSSKNHTPQLSPQLGNPYARYPIHVERAVYRLSHIKLANPRRPLYEQVLISNLMFWYLGVINKTQQANQPAGQASGTSASQAASGSQASTSDTAEKERMEQEQREQREREEKERVERERQEREQKDRMERERERERIEQKKETRRGSLTKPNANPGRRAEMPVKSPQYGLQHQVIEQEYGVGNGYGQIPPGGQPSLRPSSAPPGAAPANASGHYRSGSPAQPQQHHHPQPVHPQSARATPVQQHHQQPPPQQQHHNPNYYYGSPGVPAPQRPASPGRSQANSHLPPGAMSPYMVDQNWLNQAPQVSRSHSGSSPQQPIQSMPDNYGYPQARSPPQQQQHFFTQDPNHHVNNPNGGAKLPGRSLSATAAPPSHNQDQNHHSHPNGGHVLRKKSPSATAAPPADWSRSQRQAAGMVGGAGEDEDVPLSIWQHQQQQQQQQWRR